MSDYIERLSPDDKQSVRHEESSALFRFGDGGECRSVKRMLVPVKIGRRKYTMKIEVVKAEIPLLISKEAMKSIGMCLDFQKDEATIVMKKLLP
jgi:hypothetical protein